MNDFKAILFDLDGTIISSTKELHYLALNQALTEVAPGMEITRYEHETLYDALSTGQKLDLLSERKGLPFGKRKIVNDRKQEITREMIATTDFDGVPRKCMERLKEQKYLLGLCTNTISSTTAIFITKLDLDGIFDVILTNEDVTLKKPHPEIYQLAAQMLGVDPSDCLVIEDSEHGIQSGTLAGCNVFETKDYLDTIRIIEDL